MAHMWRFVFEIIGKIYRGQSNWGVITEIGLYYILYTVSFYCNRDEARLDACEINANVDIIRI